MYWEMLWSIRRPSFHLETCTSFPCEHECSAKSAAYQLLRGCPSKRRLRDLGQMTWQWSLRRTPCYNYHWCSTGVEQNDFTNILNLGSDENTVRVKTLYHNVDDLKNFLAKNSKKIIVLSLNIDSLNSKFDELNILIHTLAESNVQTYTPHGRIIKLL